MSTNDNLSIEPISPNPASYLSEPPSTHQEIRQNNDVDLKAREKAVALFHRTYQSARGYRDFVDKSAVDGSRMNAQFEDEFHVVIHLKQGCELTNTEQEKLHQEFWDNLHVISPILHMFDEQILHSGMLKLSFAYGTDQAERSGKYQYFL